MIILEFVAIITVLILEAITLQTGSIKILTNCFTKNKNAKLMGLRLFSAFLLWAGSILYLVFAFSWCFSSAPPVQAAGLVLMTMSGISVFGFKVVGREKPVWYCQLDSCISMACVLIVALARIKGF